MVKLAHSREVSVEAQVGHLPNPTSQGDGETIDTEMARAFVEETGIDALGDALGSVHILTRGKSPIDEDALGKFRDAVKIPLVPHGGTGIPHELAPNIIRLDVAKLIMGPRSSRHSWKRCGRNSRHTTFR